MKLIKRVNGIPRNFYGVMFNAEDKKTFEDDLAMHRCRALYNAKGDTAVVEGIEGDGEVTVTNGLVVILRADKPVKVSTMDGIREGFDEVVLPTSSSYARPGPRPKPIPKFRTRRRRN